MWRTAIASDDDHVVTLCLALNAEDPGPEPVPAERVRRTLLTLREEPQRGRAVVLEYAGAVRGYALLIAYWSNEFGGELCMIDEVFVEPAYRGRGLGTQLFEALARESELWPVRPAALALEVRPENSRARSLYERLGFRGKNQVMLRTGARP